MSDKESPNSQEILSAVTELENASDQWRHKDGFLRISDEDRLRQIGDRMYYAARRIIKILDKEHDWAFPSQR